MHWQVLPILYEKYFLNSFSSVHLYCFHPSHLLLELLNILVTGLLALALCHCLVTQLCLTPCNPMDCSMPGFLVLCYLLEFAQIESMMPSNHLILCWPLLLLPSIFSSIRVFSNELVFASGGQNIGASASASVLPMNTQGWFPLRLTGLILLPKGLSRIFSALQFKSIILRCSAFFMVQLSHPYMTTGKKTALTRRTLLAKWCLCFLICCLGLS